MCVVKILVMVSDLSRYSPDMLSASPDPEKGNCIISGRRTISKHSAAHGDHIAPSRTTHLRHDLTFYQRSPSIDSVEGQEELEV